MGSSSSCTGDDADGSAGSVLRESFVDSRRIVRGAAIGGEGLTMAFERDVDVEYGPAKASTAMSAEKEETATTAMAAAKVNFWAKIMITESQCS